MSVATAVDVCRALKGVLNLPPMTSGIVIVANVGEPVRVIVKSFLPAAGVYPLAEVVKEIVVGETGDVTTLPFAEEVAADAVGATLGGPIDADGNPLPHVVGGAAP